MIDTGMMTGQQSEVYGIAGYLDEGRRLSGFSENLAQFEGMFTYLMSEKRFSKLRQQKDNIIWSLKQRREKETLVKKRGSEYFGERKSETCRNKAHQLVRGKKGERQVFFASISQNFLQRHLHISRNRIFSAISAAFF